MTNNQNKKDLEDWSAYMKDTADHFGISQPLLNKIALYFLYTAYSDFELWKEGNEPPTEASMTKTSLRELRERVKHTA
jgi:hypothetical protein